MLSSILEEIVIKTRSNELKADTLEEMEQPGFYTATNNVATNHTISTTETTIFVDTLSAAGAITITLPVSANVTGRILIVADIDGNASVRNIVVDGNAAETIDGSATITINGDYGYLIIQSDGIGWKIISSFGTSGIAVGERRILAKSASYPIVAADYIVGGWLTITMDATGGNRTVTLPALSGAYDSVRNIGLVVNVKKLDSSANTVTVDGNGAETIDGAATQIIVAQYDNIQMQAGASEWHII